ncbi:hypothetical protein TWF696_003720 [Orbilia brochopaga]|uniref:CipC-like antibiotic response protein n=1 Tax=Orbilia brochopaga TaxID=3140254 RepID=A0AAV9V5M4_9PEZI
MADWDSARSNYQEVHHEGKLSHELIAGAAAFAGIHEFEKTQRAKGGVVNHELAKEILGSLAAAEADKLIETKGRDAWDRERTKREAKHNAERLYDQQYGNQDQYDPYNQQPHPYVNHEEHRHHHRRDD